MGQLIARLPGSRLVRKVREVGLRYTIRLVIRMVVPAYVFRLTRMVILQLRPQTATPASAAEGIRWAGADDVAQLDAFGHTAEVVQERLDAGARSCVVLRDGALLAYVWFHGPTHDEEDLAVRFVLGPQELWLFDAMVHPEQRGQGIYPGLLRFAACDLAREGVRRIWIAIETSNRNSVRAHRSAGAEPVATVCSLRVAGFTFVSRRGRVRWAWTGRAGHVCVTTSDLA
jgi:ribosomal protein S18 acetylase RimI-like enzyme